MRRPNNPGPGSEARVDSPAGGDEQEAVSMRGASAGGGVPLGGASLGGASLRGASLRGASLGGAFLGGAFTGGTFVESAKRTGGRARPRPTGEHSPVKAAPWEWYIPIYFWLGGISAGSWMALVTEDVAGAHDRDVVRAGRYISVATLLAGTVLLIDDLGRPERFLKMLRIFRARSAMSLGSWTLAVFGLPVGAAAVLQAAEDGILGDALGQRDRLTRWSRGPVGRMTHLAGLPVALFLGAYTGALLSSSSVPAWGRRRAVLPTLFLTSGLSNGLAAVTAVLEATGGGSAGARRRLARAETVTLGAELVVLALDRSRIADLPSVRNAPLGAKIGAALVATAGVATPLAVRAREGYSRRTAVDRIRARRRRGPSAGSLLAAGLALAGGLALRFLSTHEGYRSARVPADTWKVAQRAG